MSTPAFIYKISYDIDHACTIAGAPNVRTTVIVATVARRKDSHRQGMFGFFSVRHMSSSSFFVDSNFNLAAKKAEAAKADSDAADDKVVSD